jgi:hypothetical protein
MDTRRQIIVTGVPTSGKTAFSKELAEKFSLQHIQTDRLVTAFERAFPELGITHKAGSQNLAGHLAVCEKFRPFLFELIDDFKNSDFVIEGFRMPAEDLMKRYGSTHQLFVFGYPSSTPEERVALCRKFDTDNWTNGVADDAALLKEFAYLIEESRRLEALCKKYSVTFIDVSAGRAEALVKALGMVQ